jgi:hypothetical protein
MAGKPIEALLGVVVVLLTLAIRPATPLKIHRSAMEAYVDLPTLQELGSGFHKEVKVAVERLNVTQSDFKSLAPVVDALKEAIASPLAKPNHLATYQELLSLSTRDDYCSSDLIATYLSAWAQAETESDKVGPMQPIKTYIFWHADRKFEICAERENKEFERRPIEYEDVNRVFKRALSVGGDSSTSFFRALKQLDMSHSQFDVSGMAEAARELVSQPDRADEVSTIQAFMRFMCERVNGPVPSRARIYTVISLAQLFYERMYFDPRLLVLNEYHRLCRAWSRPASSEEIVANLRSQSKAPDGWSAAKLLCCN